MTDPQELVEQALRLSSGDGCVALVSDHSQTNLRWAANSLTTNGQAHSRSMTVVSLADKAGGTSAGVITRSVAALDEVADLVRAAEQAARHAEPAEDAVPLIEPYANDDEWDAAPRRTDAAVFERFTADLSEVFARWESGDQLLYGYAEHEVDSSFLGTSTGLRRRFDQPTGIVEINGKSADLARSSWAGMHTVDFTDVDVAGIAEDLDRRLAWAQSRIELPPGRYETILPPSAVADLMIYGYWTMSARDAEEGRSVFAGPRGTRIGERLAGLPLTLRSDPQDPRLRCRPFELAAASSAGLQSVFDNGQPVEAANWIDRGTLTDLVRTRAWAQRTDSEARPYVDNLILESPTETEAADLEAMIANTERGLLLTCLWYIREVDPQTLLLTGLTRDGVYLVEDGKVRAAVNNFRFNESPIDLLARATEAGASVPTLAREWSDYFRRTAMPTLRIPDFNMSTVSKAH